MSINVPFYVDSARLSLAEHLVSQRAALEEQAGDAAEEGVVAKLIESQAIAITKGAIHRSKVDVLALAYKVQGHVAAVEAENFDQQIDAIELDDEDE